MLELGVGADLLRGFGWFLWGVLALALALALIKPQTVRGKAIAVAVVLAIFFGPMLPGVYRSFDYRVRYAEAKALFDERCKTAGEKVLRTVDGVEGIALTKLRIGDRTAGEADPNWAGAGLPNDATNNGYISSFLEWEHSSGTGENVRRYLNPTAKNAKSAGYRFVDVRQVGGDYIRYRLNTNRVSSADELLIRIPLTGRPSRYAVSYEDISTAEDRKFWVAGARVAIIDTESGDLMAELRAYSIEPGLRNTVGGRQPWRFGRTCPQKVERVAYHATRFFVDEVVKPIQEQ